MKGVKNSFYMIIIFSLLTLNMLAQDVALGMTYGESGIVKTNIELNGKTSLFSSERFSGNVSGIWDADTVYIDGDISIPRDSSLTITSGTNVYFTGEYKFDVYGTLTANGTETDSIFFFSDSLREISTYPYYAGFWYGITLHATDSTSQTPSTFKYCNIKYAFERWLNEASLQFNRRFGGGVIFYKSKVNISDSKFYQCYNYGSAVTALYSYGNLDNLVVGKSGFIELIYSDVDIDNTEIFSGFGMRLASSNSIITNTRIHDNNNYFSYPSGFGAIVADSSNFTLENCEITNNIKSGIVALNSSPLIKHTLIKDNGLYGGFFQESPITAVRTEITGNGSGGLRFQSSQNWQSIFTSDIQNCGIVKNNGIGIYFLSNNNANIVNCTIADNNYTNGWGGIQTGDSPTYVTNSIVWNNGSDLDFQAGGLYTYSIIQGNYVGSDTATTNLQNVDPLFRDAENGDYHLQSGDCGYAFNSPGIDAGHPDSLDAVIDCQQGLGTVRADIGFYGGRYSEMPVGISEGNDNQIPRKYELSQNYPNPFNPTTTINYAVPAVERRHALSLQLIVYDILGRKIATLVNQKQAPGNYSVQFDASKLSSGIYYYTLRAGDFVQTKKMILMK